jgi:endogenous inhibitor of DNA gyrase (YacG/DUF329 family)
MKTKCPTCKKWTEWQNNLFKPFCSERCKLIDLGAWVSGKYRIAGKREGESSQTPLNREIDND